MKVVIIETGHFQYALTQIEVFSDCEISIITTDAFQKDMIEYSPAISSYEFFTIENITKNEKNIIGFIKNRGIDLLLISPIFDSYGALKRIVKKINCTKVITIHNINTWFYHRFWSPNSFKDRINMLSIIKNCNYIAVEDFIYNHLKNTNNRLFQKYKFIYIPFTIFHKNKQRKYLKNNSITKVVLTGYIDGDRRRYEEVLEVINYFKEKNHKIMFSFAGKAKGEYGKMIQNKLRDIKIEFPEFVSFFEDNSTADMFRKEMETSDIVLSTSTKTFNGMGTIEYIGKTKPTAAIHDMMTYELPGLLPSHLMVPTNLEGSVFNYNGVNNLIKIFENLLNNPSILIEWKENAKKNSLKFIAHEIRKSLPL